MSVMNEKLEDFSSILLQHQQYFPHGQSIINFIQNKQKKSQKKNALTGWNDFQYQKDQHVLRQVCISPGFNSEKNRIQEFLYTIQRKNPSFNKFRTRMNKKSKKEIHNQTNQQKNDMFLHLNNTIITFPKSHYQYPKIQSQQKIVLQKLYRKRQKSKIIPKQITISNINETYSTINQSNPSKSYISKSKSFIQQNHLNKVYNPQSKTMKQLPDLRKKITSSYHKKTNGVFLGEGRIQKLLFKNKNPSQKHIQVIHNNKSTRIHKKLKQIQNQFQSSPEKLYKTFYSSPKISSLTKQNDNQFSIMKIRQQAKNTHLNRTKKFNEKQGIQLIGSTLTQWKSKVKEQLKNMPKQNIKMS